MEQWGGRRWGCSAGRQRCGHRALLMKQELPSICSPCRAARADSAAEASNFRAVARVLTLALSEALRANRASTARQRSKSKRHASRRRRDGGVEAIPTASGPGAASQARCGTPPSCCCSPRRAPPASPRRRRTTVSKRTPTPRARNAFLRNNAAATGRRRRAILTGRAGSTCARAILLGGDLTTSRSSWRPPSHQTTYH